MLKSLFIVFLFLKLSLNSNANTYYSIGNVAPNTLSNWNTQRNGLGTAPNNFTTNGDIFIIQGIGGLLSAPHFMTSGSTVTFGAGVTVKVETGATLQGNSTISFNASANFVLDSAANYNHNNTGNYVSTILGGIENFHKQSNFYLLNSTGTGPNTPSNGGFGNLIINSNGSSQVNCSGLLTLIKNDFIIIKTGSSTTNEFRLTGSTDFVLEIGGNLDIQGGILNFSNGIGIGTINLKGGFLMSGGDLRNTNSINPNIQNINFIANKLHNFIKTAGTITSTTSNGRTIAFNVNAFDTLNLSNYILDNAVNSTVTFTALASSTLQIGHPDGISNSGSTGNIQVTGTRLFSKGANYIYNGSTAQITGNGLPDSVRTFNINNPNGVTLSNSSLTDTLTLYLTNGNIKTDATHSLILAKSASIISNVNVYGDVNQGNNLSFVDGPIIIETNKTDIITAPVGKMDAGNRIFAPVHLFPFNTTLKKYTVEYINMLYDTAHYDVNIHHVSALEHWNIGCNISTVDDSKANVELSWRPSSRLCIGNCSYTDSVNAWTDLAIAHYNLVGSTYWFFGGINSTFTIRSGSTISYGYIKSDQTVSTFSSFTLVSRYGYNLLPLQIKRFDLKELNNKVLLTLETHSEINIDKIELEKSNDGIAFNTYKTQLAKNTNYNQYFFSDNDILKSCFYRIKIIHLNGSITYSEILKYNLNEKFFSTYPNPVKDILNIKVNNNNAKNSTIAIYSSDGKMVIKSNFVNQINLSNLKKGIYFIVVESDNKKLYFKSLYKD
jgi:hypothetical protein